MRTIKQISQFKRDFKRESKGKYRKTLADDFKVVLLLLLSDAALPKKYFDHAMIGDWKDHCNCHIKPDLILMYRLPDDETLQLVRLGSHSELSI
jgi:mRNA interferase YafQ